MRDKAVVLPPIAGQWCVHEPCWQPSIGEAKQPCRHGELDVVASSPGKGQDRADLWMHDAESEHGDQMTRCRGDERPYRLKYRRHIIWSCGSKGGVDDDVEALGVRERFVYHFVVVGAQVLVPFGELPCTAGHLKTVAHLPEAIPDRLVVVRTQMFAANRDEGTAMHEEDADEVPVPWLGA